MKHDPGKTAIRRNRPSNPIKALHSTGIFKDYKWVLDYGCGHGADIDFIERHTKTMIKGWDPVHRPDGLQHYKRRKWDIILCTYVLNVLTPRERKKLVENVRKLLKKGGKAYFSVRREGPGGDLIKGERYWDGVITKKGTFQRLFTAKQILRSIPGSKLVFDNKRYVTVEVGP